MKLFVIAIACCFPAIALAEVRVPAFTAYIQPHARGAHVSEERGITRWKNPEDTLNWYGKFAQTGQLSVKVEMKVASGKSRYQLTIGQQSHEVSLTSSETLADFGSYQIDSPGYQRITLTALDQPDEFLASVTTLILDGEATKDVHFNLKERRNAASVHLMYPAPKDVQVEAFACEVTAIEDPVTTFYMACGWHRGYFGMQVNSPTERRIIFSVWDSGDEAVSRDKVADDNRVKLINKGEGVYTGDFGNEGTGGHSHLKTMWKTGETQRFVVTAEPVDKTFTIYSGYWFKNDEKKWMLISAWKAPKEGGYLRGLHSFSENFGGDTGHLQRKALYGNQWIRTTKGNWLELTTAKFSHDPTGKSDRFDRSMGVEKGQFFLSHGGFSNDSTTYGESFTRPALGVPPEFSVQ